MLRRFIIVRGGDCGIFFGGKIRNNKEGDSVYGVLILYGLVWEERFSQLAFHLISTEKLIASLFYNNLFLK